MTPLDEQDHARVTVFNENRVSRARTAMLSSDEADRVAETFKVLASPTRVQIIRALSQGELCVNDIAVVVRLSISATSHQLGTLRRAGIVGHRVEGKHIYYELRDSFVERLLMDCPRM